MRRRLALGMLFAKVWKIVFRARNNPMNESARSSLDFSRITSPIHFEGTASTAYRDPAAYYYEGMFYLYFSLATIEKDGLAYSRTAWSKSRDLVTWSEPICFTPLDREKNFSSPGCVIRDGKDFLLCLQTYPTPHVPQSASVFLHPLGVVLCADLWN